MRRLSLLLLSVATASLAGALVHAGPDYAVPEIVKQRAHNHAVGLTGAGSGAGLLDLALRPAGSGVVVGGSSLVLTAWHVVVPLEKAAADAGRQPSITVYGGEGAASGDRRSAKLVYAWPDMDLALLSVDSVWPRPPLPLAADLPARSALDSRPPVRYRTYPAGYTNGLNGDRGDATKAQEVRKWGFVQKWLGTLWQTIDTGEVSGTATSPVMYSADEARAREQAATKYASLIRRSLPGDPDPLYWVTSNSWATPGQSGGPVFNDNGELVGISSYNLSEGTEVRGFGFVPAQSVRAFLVGVDDTGATNATLIRRFAECGGAKEVGLPYSKGGSPLVHRWGGGMVQPFRRDDGQETALMLADGTSEAHWVRGGIWATYASSNGPVRYGYPKGDEHEYGPPFDDVLKDRAQEFTLATLVWDHTTGKANVRAEGGPDAPSAPKPDVIIDPLDHNNGKWAVDQWFAFENGAYHLRGARIAWAYNYGEGLAQIDTELAGGPLGQAYGLCFRLKRRAADHDSSGYQLWIAADGMWKLVKLKDGTTTDLTQWARSDALRTGAGAANQIGVVCHGEAIEAILNGQQVGQIRDASYADGGVGPASTDEKLNIAFRNLRIDPRQAPVSSNRPLLASTPRVDDASMGKPGERQGTRTGEETVGPDGGTYVWVPPGEFTMGSDEGYPSERPAHRVRITKGFWLGKCTVTNAQYRQYCRATGVEFPKGSHQGDNHPVVFVNWDDAVGYCKHYGLSLPTEAQWEYAARGSEGRKYPWGNEWDGKKCCNMSNHGPGGTTFPIGSFPEGASWCGALDMAGNVWQWCGDVYAEDYYKVSPDTDPQGPAGGSYRLLRGSSWEDLQGGCRSADRGGGDSRFGNGVSGFRCARTP